jgi:hypothetical protein
VALLVVALAAFLGTSYLGFHDTPMSLVAGVAFLMALSVLGVMLLTGRRQQDSAR